MSARWEGSQTTRLNREHWGRVRIGESINHDLIGELDVQRLRAEYELQNNGYVAGLVETYVQDVVGEDGPLLTVRSASKRYNEKLQEGFWRWWTEQCDFLGELSGAELLKLSVRSFFPNGEFFNQMISVEDAPDGEIALRLLAIHPVRIATPIDRFADSSIVLGIERDRDGRPKTFHVRESDLSGLKLSAFLKTVPVRAVDMIHGYKRLEPGQARGVPWLAPVLQVIADLRDYETQVLDAARQAASWAIFLESQDPDGPAVVFTEDVEVERDVQRALPPGYTAKQMQGQQPGTQYESFHDSKLREIGRPFGMPLMTLKLDSAEHSYSSARFDGQVYHRGIRATQGWLSRIMMKRLVDQVARELELLGQLPRRPHEVEYLWTWPTPPHVDPSKEAAAADMRYNRIGTTSLTQECASMGHDWATIQAQRQEEERAIHAGLVSQIEQLQPLIDAFNKKHPKDKLHWSHILAASAAKTAPGAYIQGATGQNAAAESSSTARGKEESEDEDDDSKAERTRLARRARQLGSGAPHRNGAAH